MSCDSRRRRLLAAVERPARYAGGEFGAFDPSARSDPTGTICLVFPDAYEVGASHLGLRVLQAEVNAEPDLWAERAFAPWPDLAAALRADGTPLWSLESGRPLADFDVVGLNLSHELAAATVPAVLALGGIPPASADRDDRHPIVLGGGTWASHPAAVAPFFDAFFVGDAEGALPSLVREAGRSRRAGVPRSARLERLGEHPAVWVPALAGTGRPGARAALRRVPALPDSRPFAAGPVPTLAAVFDRVTLEIARGCGNGCRFCQAGYLYRPERHRTVESLVAEVEASLRHTGCDEVSLSSLSTADHPDLFGLLDRLAPLCADRTLALGVSSLRAHGLSSEALARIAHTRRTGLTLAPEAGTQRLRDVASKRVTDPEIVDAVRRVAAAGWRRVKLYFMIGLPTETDEDVLGIADLVDRVVDAARTAGARGFRTTVSVSTFVPKPHTPFQWEPMIPPGETRRRQALLRRSLRSRQVELRTHDPEAGCLEALLARGDERAARAVALAAADGAYLDAWTEHFRWDRWLCAFDRAGVSPDEASRALDPGASTPWEAIDCGVDVEHFRRERDLALRAVSGDRCDPSAERFRCRACGIGCAPPPGGDATAERAVPPPDVATGADRPGTGAAGAGGLVRGEASTAGDGATPEPTSGWWRLVVAKSGPAVWAGHLDFSRALARAFRRAGLPIEYSRGFHPAPRLSMAAPLPLGCLGLAEPGDVRLGSFDAAGDDGCARLTRSAPAGVAFLSLRPLGEGESRSGRAAAAAEYLAAVPGWTEAAAAARVALLESIDRWLLRDPRREKWDGRDVRPEIRGLGVRAVPPTAASRLPEPAAWGLGFRLPLPESPPPAAVVAALLGEVAGAAIVIRTGILDAAGRPLD